MSALFPIFIIEQMIKLMISLRSPYLKRVYQFLGSSWDSGSYNYGGCVDVISPHEYPKHYAYGGVLETMAMMVQHNSGSFGDILSSC